VLRAFTDKLNGIAQPMRQTLTATAGKETARHRSDSLAWRCTSATRTVPGSNPTRINTNGLVSSTAQGLDLSVYSQEQLDAIADEMNGRPRQTSDWASPLRFSGWLARLNVPEQAVL
jgi:IS30 family transposase